MTMLYCGWVNEPYARNPQAEEWYCLLEISHKYLKIYSVQRTGMTKRAHFPSLTAGYVSVKNEWMKWDWQMKIRQRCTLEGFGWEVRFGLCSSISLLARWLKGSTLLQMKSSQFNSNMNSIRRTLGTINAYSFGDCSEDMGPSRIFFYATYNKTPDLRLVKSMNIFRRHSPGCREQRDWVCIVRNQTVIKSMSDQGEMYYIKSPC